MPLYPYRRRGRDARQEATPPPPRLRTRLPRGRAREGALQRRRGAGLCPRRAGVAAAVWRRGRSRGAGKGYTARIKSASRLVVYVSSALTTEVPAIERTAKGIRHPLLGRIPSSCSAARWTSRSSGTPAAGMVPVLS